MIKSLISYFQYIIPHHLLSRLMRRIMHSKHFPFRDLFTKIYISIYKVNMQEAIEPDYTNRQVYPDFNSIFTRPLRPEARPIVESNNQIACPVDGTVSQSGDTEGNQILQAKGHSYTLEQLLGGSETLTQFFEGGCYSTLYLSPRDYHRIHMPLKGRLEQMIHIPGRLFSVSPTTVNTIPGLFARNERVVCIFETTAGPMAVIMVGAIFVGSIETVWAGEITPPKGKSISITDYKSSNSSVMLEQGQELGRFNMGSTVILLFGRNKIQWIDSLHPGQTVQMGQLIGELIK